MGATNGRVGVRWAPTHIVSPRVLPHVGVHVGLALVAMSAFAPWATIGGRSHDGFATANVLLTLTHDGLPAEVGWFASSWYAGAFLVVVGWAVVSLVPRSWAAWAAAVSFVVAGVVMLGFAWAVGEHGRIATRRLGPGLAVAALTLMTFGSIAAAVLRARDASRRGAHGVRHTPG